MLLTARIDLKPGIAKVLDVLKVTLLSSVFFCNFAVAESTLVSQAKTAYDQRLYVEAADLYEKAYVEAKKNLPGKQEKLDVDKDGKLEKSDFAALRAGKKEKETVKESADLTRMKQFLTRLNG